MGAKREAAIAALVAERILAETREARAVETAKVGRATFRYVIEYRNGGFKTGTLHAGNLDIATAKASQIAKDANGDPVGYVREVRRIID